ncbi:o-succinylbenzoate synthase [Myxacorys almedinensis A]|uniref:o-succinylbenzoate synthase n=2 Tax=Myxacorys TaxID=2056239 RepID=A0A8J7YWU5_9CYAN|nr:o-succinylbenzoate synthase [Myxacorys almedinensis A]
MRFEFRPYSRAFNPPLLTCHGVWRIRRGIIVRLSDESGVGFGEIAPLDWFGSERVEDAIAFCQSLPSQIDRSLIRAIPADLPACQFGFESALPSVSRLETPRMSALLPPGERACQGWETLWQQGYRTFKWKIGVNAIGDELKTLKQLAEWLPNNAKLRLDANAGLTVEQAHQWLEAGDTYNIEFIEQPLPVDQFETMVALSQQYATTIALDESVATLRQLQTCYDHGWRGIFVIKPAIAGSPARLRQFCQQHSIDAVFSSVFETAIAREAGLNLAAELSCGDRAVGYGTTHWFTDLVTENFEELWQRLSPC